MPSSEERFEALRQIIVTLRQPGGCPWDRRQTPQSLKSYLLEEAHELLEAIDRDDAGLVREELGDLFFQLVFIGQLFEEQGRFTIAESLAGIVEKMIKRHPHVFGDEVVASEEEQRRRWNQLKAAEKKESGAVVDLLNNVPRSLPALRRAQRVCERAAHNGFEWRDTGQALAKLEEEVGELRQAVAKGQPEMIDEELGDVLFMLVNLGRLNKLNCEDSLTSATNKFIRRFTRLEAKAKAGGRTVAELSLAEQLGLWAEVKDELAREGEGV